MSRRETSGLRTCAAVALLVLLAPVPGSAQEEARAEAAWIDAMAQAAKAYVQRMGQHADVRIDFGDDERHNWHYVPRARRGVALRDMTEPQRAAAWELMRSGLSARGAQRVEATMALQDVLHGPQRTGRNALDYSVTVFGTPGTPPWAWRVEGHHLSVNVTVPAAGHVSMTPLFTGARPARVRTRDGRGHAHVHDTEHRVALALAQSLDERQWRSAVIADRPLADIVTGPGRAQSFARRQGLAASAMSEPQRAQLLELIQAYVGLAKDEWGRPYMDLVRTGLDETHFAWAGSRREGSAFYWRIHGPRVLIEFDHTQGDTNHVHSVWRDPLNDFGRDVLREHYGHAGHDAHRR
jgi:hypothetical protein